MLYQSRSVANNSDMQVQKSHANQFVKNIHPVALDKHMILQVYLALLEKCAFGLEILDVKTGCEGEFCPFLIVSSSWTLACT